MKRTGLTAHAVLIALALLVAHPASPDSLFSRASADSGTLISDKKVRFEVGDIITVLVRENVSATTQADTKTEKQSDIESIASAQSNPFLVGQNQNGMNILNRGELPNWKVEAENEFETIGKTRRLSTLTMTIACTVAEVMPSGNLLLEGTKSVKVNREDTLLSITGIARARDVTASNTILSNQIANAQIDLSGKGPLWNNQRRGFFTKLLDWFSPF